LDVPRRCDSRREVNGGSQSYTERGRVVAKGVLRIQSRRCTGGPRYFVMLSLTLHAHQNTSGSQLRKMGAHRRKLFVVKN
jgi:hypothetical protein